MTEANIGEGVHERTDCDRGEASAPTGEELIARARSMIPVIAGRAAEDEARRRLSSQTIAEFREAGLFRVMQPRRWGGYEMEPVVFAEIHMALGEGDLSAAWVYAIFAGHAYHLALFDPVAQEAVWGENPDALVASSYAPSGRSVQVDGGYRLSGRWKFSSGSDHCDWVMLGALTDSSPPEHRVHLIRRQDCEIVDAWHVTGLKGTGSQDVVVEDLFVPAHATLSHTQTMSERQPGQSLNTNPIYHVPYMQVFYRGITTGCIGALQGMLDAYRAYGKTKADKRGRALIDNPDAQLACGEAAAGIVEMKATLRRNYATLMSYARAGRKPSIEERLLFRKQAAEVAGRCARLARALSITAGGGGLYETELPFGRICRNLEAAEAHPASLERAYARAYGYYLLTGQASDLMI